MGACDGVRPGLAIGVTQALREPCGCVVIQRIAFQQYFFARAGEIAQDSVDERSVGRVFRLKTGHADTKIDGGVIGNVEKKNLGRRRDQRPFKAGGLTRQTFFQKPVQGGTDGAQPAKRDGDNRAGQGDVARFQTAKPREDRRARKAFVERMTSGDNIVQDRRRGETRGQTGALLALPPSTLTRSQLVCAAVRNLSATPPVRRRTRRCGQTRDSATKASGRQSRPPPSTNRWTSPSKWARIGWKPVARVCAAFPAATRKR